MSVISHRRHSRHINGRSLSLSTSSHLLCVRPACSHSTLDAESRQFGANYFFSCSLFSAISSRCWWLIVGASYALLIATTTSAIVSQTWGLSCEFVEDIHAWLCVWSSTTSLIDGTASTLCHREIALALSNERHYRQGEAAFVLSLESSKQPARNSSSSWLKRL